MTDHGPVMQGTDTVVKVTHEDVLENLESLRNSSPDLIVKSQ